MGNEVKNDCILASGLSDMILEDRKLWNAHPVQSINLSTTNADPQFLLLTHAGNLTKTSKTQFQKEPHTFL